MPAEAESWVEMRIAAARDPEAIVAALFAEGSQGVQEVGDEIVTYFPAATATERIRSLLNELDPSCVVVIQEADLPNYSNWRDGFQIHNVGELAISPPWLSAGLDPASTVVVDPAMAFGTGEHPTTRGVLRLMQSIPLAGKVVADLGAGSGILSIAAAKLGARKVIAIELDADAASNAALNIESNAVAGCVHFVEGDAFALLPLLAPVDVILANILSLVLVDLLPVMRDSLVAHGSAILSGILLEERPAMLKCIDLSGWRIDAEDSEEEWWSVLISRA